MIDQGHVRIALLPSRASQMWINAIQSACAAADWDCHLQIWDHPNPPLNPGRRAVVLAWWSFSPEGPPSDWIVLAAPPPEVEATLLSEGLSPLDARHQAALRLTLAVEILNGGGRLVQSSDTVLAVPGLGQIEREPYEGEWLAHDSLHPLAASSIEPERRVTSLRWGPELFVYHDGGNAEPGVIPLLGRRRLLLNGPHISVLPGTWTLEVEFSIRPEPAADLFIEWGHGHETAKFQDLLDKPGRYRLQMTHEWISAAPADFRISLMMPALDGLLEFHGGLLTAGSPDDPAFSLEHKAQT